MPVTLRRVQSGGVRHLHLYALFPLTREEVAFKLDFGAEALARAYFGAGHDVVELGRAELRAKKGR